MALPRPPFPLKPDWRATGGTSYESSKALGHLFRAIDDRQTTESDQTTMRAIDNLKEFRSDPITMALEKSARKHLDQFVTRWPPATSREFCLIYERYVAELRYICSVHALSNTAEIRLLEEAEVVVGTMLGAPKDWKKDRKFRMRMQTEVLVTEVRKWFFTTYEPREALQYLWDAWAFALSKRDTFGANSFSWIVLGLFLQCLQSLEDESSSP
jgi:RNA-dependent RNA polymerase